MLIGNPRNKKAADNFVKNFANVLYRESFDQKSFDRAVKSFKKGSVFNTTGEYAHLPDCANKNISIQNLFPLLKKRTR